jgi:hypothetical protein
MLLFHASEPTLDSWTPWSVLSCKIYEMYLYQYELMLCTMQYKWCCLQCSTSVVSVWANLATRARVPELDVRRV